jgi:carboxylesterase type B
MIGVNADEGLLTSLLFYNSEQKMEAFAREWDKCVLRTFGIPIDTPNAEAFANGIKEIYFPQDTTFTKETKLLQYTKLFSDSNFNLHVSHCISVQKQFSPVYPYYFSRTGGPSLTVLLDMLMKRSSLPVKLLKFIATTLYNKVTGNRPTDYGVCHGDDLAMLFVIEKVFHVKKDPNSEDYKFSKDMVKLWVDFARDETSLTFRGAKFPVQDANDDVQYFDLCETPKLIPEPFADRTDALKSLGIIELPLRRANL